MGPLQNTIDLLTNNDVIIACATPSSVPMGLSVIRISGNFTENCFSTLIRSPSSGPMGPLKARYATLVNLCDPTENTIIDTGIILYFPAPHSFTGENVLELSIHGNPRLVEKIIDLFIAKFSLRPATPGEFTLRAYRNKKLNLSQVEGLDLLLHASTQPLIKLSQYMLAGSLQKEFIELKDAFDKHQASIDILTDFAEDVGQTQSKNLLISTWTEIKKLINVFHARSSIPLSQLLKPSIVLFGPPNAGKSTLFNTLLGHKRSIVSSIPGTTRDYIKESIFYKNNEFSLVDTAGIRESAESIEEEGIYFTLKNLHESYAPILVYSAINFNFQNFISFYKLRAPKVVVITHFTGSCELHELKSLDCPIFYVDLLAESYFADMLLSTLEFDLSEFFATNPILIERQRIEITKVFNLISKYDQLIMSDIGTDLAIVSHEFNFFRQSANNLIGYVDVDEILSYVFSNFCIGK